MEEKEKLRIKYLYNNNFIHCYATSLHINMSNDGTYAELLVCEDVPPMPEEAIQRTTEKIAPNDNSYVQKAILDTKSMSDGYNVTRLIHARIKMSTEDFKTIIKGIAQDLDIQE